MLRYEVPDNVIVVIEGKDSKCVQSTHVSWKFAVCSPALRVQLASLVTLPMGLDTLFLTQRSTKPDISAEIPGFRKTMDSSEDEG